MCYWHSWWTPNTFPDIPNLHRAVPECKPIQYQPLLFSISPQQAQLQSIEKNVCSAGRVPTSRTGMFYSGLEPGLATGPLPPANLPLSEATEGCADAVEMWHHHRANSQEVVHHGALFKVNKYNGSGTTLCPGMCEELKGQLRSGWSNHRNSFSLWSNLHVFRKPCLLQETRFLLTWLKHLLPLEFGKITPMCQICHVPIRHFVRYILWRFSVNLAP